MKSFKSYITERCWPGYKETPGKKAYEKGSCVKEEVDHYDTGYDHAMNHALDSGNSETARSRKKEMLANNPHKKGTTEHSEWHKGAVQGHSDGIRELRGEQVETEDAEQLDEASPAWTRKEGKSESGGLNRKGIESYRRENPGSKLSMAVTTKPSKLKPGSKAANRRKSFCARMGGMKKRLTSAKTANDPDSRINKALRKWNC
jgi:hypothetical protein